MKQQNRRMISGWSVFMSGILAAVLVHAAPNEHSQNNKGEAGGKSEAGHPNTAHFDDHRRTIVSEYFALELKNGNCPPGLAKKGNGCSAPGQARQWQVGQPLSRDVVYYEIPGVLSLQLGQPPSGYRYAGVDDNILLIELGTELVVDVIHALSP